MELHPMGSFVTGGQAQSASSNLSDKKQRFSPTGLFKIRFKQRLDYHNLSTLIVMIRGGETNEMTPVFKHDLCKLVIAKMGSAITYDCTRGTESSEERFEKFANNSGVIGVMCLSLSHSFACIGVLLEVLSTFPRTAPTAKSLASHMISQGKSQSGATRIGACVNFILRVSNASMHSFEKINRVSFSMRLNNLVISLDHQETPLRVVIAFTSPFGLAMVLLGREPEPEVEAVLLFTNLVIRHTIGAGGTELGKLELKKSGLITLGCSATSNETAGVEELVLTLETMAVAFRD
ncbi:hypothetical protein Tco_1182282 [Tanacetum coccineum]